MTNTNKCVHIMPSPATNIVTFTIRHGDNIVSVVAKTVDAYHRIDI